MARKPKDKDSTSRAETFIKIWQSSESVREVSAKYGARMQTVYKLASDLRNLGIPLKTMPKTRTKPPRDYAHLRAIAEAALPQGAAIPDSVVKARERLELPPIDAPISDVPEGESEPLETPPVTESATAADPLASPSALPTVLPTQSPARGDVPTPPETKVLSKSETRGRKRH